MWRADGSLKSGIPQPRSLSDCQHTRSFYFEPDTDGKIDGASICMDFHPREANVPI